MGETAFVGYEQLAGTGRVMGLLAGGKPVEAVTASEDGGEPVELSVMLDSTPFYAESGGQVGDIGMMRTPGGATVLVSDVTKAGGGNLFVHTCRLSAGTLSVDDEVRPLLPPLPAIPPLP